MPQVADVDIFHPSAAPSSSEDEENGEESSEEDEESNNDGEVVKYKNKDQAIIAIKSPS